MQDLRSDLKILHMQGLSIITMIISLQIGSKFCDFKFSNIQAGSPDSCSDPSRHQPASAHAGCSYVFLPQFNSIDALFRAFDSGFDFS